MTISSNSKQSYYCLKEEQLLIEQFEGILDLGAIKKMKEQELKNPDFSVHYSILADIRDTQPRVNLYEIKGYEEFITQMNLLGKRRLAIVTDTPMQVAIASLFQANSINLAEDIEIFSTLEAALKWLGHFDSIQEIEAFLSSK